ncbi:choice-of-anchor Q domain-containing protein, partial [Runella aurantiaca]
MQKLFYLFLNFLLILFFGITTATSLKNPFNHPSKKAFSFRRAIFFGSLISGLFRSKPILRQILLLFIFCGGLTSAFAATLTVTNGNDSGSGSLRNQIAAATSGDVIVFASGVTTVNLTSGEIAFGKTLTIDGGASGVTINRLSGNFRLFNISSGTVTFTRINLTNGNTTDANGGGAIAASSSVTLNMTNCNITGNNTTGGGAAMVLSGPTTLTNCNISNNTTTNTVGHAILFYPPGNLTMTGCTISNNTGNVGGAAVDLRGGGGGNMTVILNNCTISGNNRSGLITPNNECTITITNVTITDNGIGFENYTNKCTMKNTIVFGNAGNNLTFVGPAFLAGSTHNIVGDAGNSGFINGTNNNQVGVDPNLLGLASNGGFTQTHALAPCSPAINAGTSSGAPTTDQRGSSRVSTVDIGAFEYQSAPSTISVTSTVTNACNGNNGSIDLTVSGGTSPYTYEWSGSGSGNDPRTNLAAGTYDVTVTDNAGCIRTHSATVTNLTPTTANAGSDQTGAATCGLTQVTLAANSPSVGTGAWSVVNGTGGSFGNASSRTSTFSGTAGSTYTLRWTISNGSCTSTDDVVITFNRSPTTANAGSDQTGAATCGLTQVTLAGNTATVGTGSWSVVNGTGGSFGNASSPTSTFTGTAGSTYTLRWTISNSPCTASTDDVVVTFNRSPTTANAGSDQTGAATCGLTQVTLAANTPTVGTGAWSVVNGTGGSFGNASSPTSTFTGTAGSTYTLRWTISNSPCTASTDDVVITFNRNPTTANAGSDQTGASTCGLTQVTLAGNTATVGTGAWSVVNGTGGSFGNAFSPTSTFTGTAGSTYTLRWTISNSPCTASTDDVVITFNRSPTTANAGSDQTGAATCGLTQVTLAGNTATVGTGSWSVVNGTGGSFGNAS